MISKTSRRREELLDLAEAVLEEVGLDNFGVGVLAQAAGIKPPSLYKHFSGIADIEDALIVRGFTHFAEELPTVSSQSEGVASRRKTVEHFVRLYRTQALAKPQLYRLMTGRPLRRESLEPGAELAAMAGLLTLLGEDETRHPKARTVWAWAHGLVVLEIAQRFPPQADLEASWALLVETVVEWSR